MTSSSSSHSKTVEIARRIAESCRNLITTLAPSSTANDDDQKALSRLEAKAHILRQHAQQLAELLKDAAVLAESPGSILSAFLRDCERDLGLLVAHRAQHPKANTDAGTWRSFEDLLAAYPRLFFFFSQILTMETEEEQMSKLKTKDGNKIVESISTAAYPARRILDSGPQE